MEDRSDFNEQQSLDDVLEAERGNDNGSVGNDKLPEDNDTPASPSDEETNMSIPDDHQALDAGSNIDSHELYDEGIPRAAEAGERRDGRTLNPGD